MTAILLSLVGRYKLREVYGRLAEGEDVALPLSVDGPAGLGYTDLLGAISATGPLSAVSSSRDRLAQ